MTPREAAGGWPGQGKEHEPRASQGGDRSSRRTQELEAPVSSPLPVRSRRGLSRVSTHTAASRVGKARGPPARPPHPCRCVSPRHQSTGWADGQEHGDREQEEGHPIRHVGRVLSDRLLRGGVRVRPAHAAQTRLRTGWGPHGPSEPDAGGPAPVLAAGLAPGPTTLTLCRLTIPGL